MIRRVGGSALLSAVVALTGVASTVSAASWNPFVIRTVGGASTPLTIVENVDGDGVTTTIDENGEKTGYGTGDFNGKSVGTLGVLSYLRVDPGTKDPYLNIWVTDNAGHFAVIAPVANMTATGDYTNNDVSGLDLKTLGFNIYETDFSNLSWLGVAGATRTKQALTAGGSVVTLADIAGLTILSPAVFPNPPIGTGAPKAGYGVNIVFGDTQGNFTSSVPYVIDNVNLTAVPTPVAAFAAVPLLGLVAMKRRRQA
jgi:hypothetical protein